MALSNDEIKRIVESSFLKADHKFEVEPVCLEISGQFGNQTFATLGNFSVFIAPPKVGKTTATGVVVAALLTGKQISNFYPMLPSEKNVIVWADTEQGKRECVKTIQLISSQATGNLFDQPENFKYSSLRKYGKDVRMAAIEYMVYNTPNIGFLVIDGIRDLVSSINDEKEATLIADKILKWTQEANIHILAILHQNKGDANARGHIGTELINKAETVATLSRGDNGGIRTTIVEPKFTRHKEFESFAFTVDAGQIIDAEINQEFEPKNPKVNQLTSFQITELLNSVFKDNSRLTYKPLCDSIRDNLKKILDLSFGIDKTKKLVIWLKEEKYLNHDEVTKTYSANLPPR
jgi:hypothetical protein